jgi:hypothetical protein
VSVVKPQRFRAKLVGRGPNEAWIFIAVPAAVTAAFATRARIPVSGTINGTAFRGSFTPDGDGTHEMSVNLELRTAAGVAAGDEVELVVERDDAPREVEVPGDLRSALDAGGAAAAYFEGMSYSHRREYVRWIEDARRPQTRERRVAQTVEQMVEGKPRR